MTRARKPSKPRRPTATKVSSAMDRVRPLAGTPAMDRRYDPGFRRQNDKDHETGEGEPEVNG